MKFGNIKVDCIFYASFVLYEAIEQHIAWTGVKITTFSRSFRNCFAYINGD